MKKSIAVTILALAFMAGGCPKGSVTHKVTAAQHDFLFTVDAFQSAEIAEHDKGFVPDNLHIQIQQGIQKVSLAGKDLDNAVASNASSVTIKSKLDGIYTLLDSINDDGLTGIKNASTKASLELALEAVKAIVSNAEVLVTN